MTTPAESIPFNVATYSESDRANLISAVSGRHTAGNGPFTKSVEQILVKQMGIHAALLTTSCTHALEMSALLARLQPGDEVIVPSYTFVSSASAFMLHGAKPIFVDVRLDTLNIDPDQVAAAITPRTRAICVVHYGGVGAEMELLEVR